jgi:ADP-ribosyl-[dinitrogen reductase] hydrolase
MRGSCLCGQVRYEVSHLDSSIRHCSCRVCRKAHAAAFNTSAAVRQEHFRWLAGEGRLTAFESSPGKHRYFCSRCGTQVVARHAGSDRFILRAATLDDDPGQVPQGHIWMSHEVPWLGYGPDVPAYPQWDPEPRRTTGGPA